MPVPVSASPPSWRSPHLEARHEPPAVLERDRAAPLQRQPQPARPRVRRREVAGFARRRLGAHPLHHRVAAQPQLEPARLRRLHQHAARARRRHLLRGVGAPAPDAVDLHVELARAVAEKPPQREPLAHLDPRIGMHARERALERARAPVRMVRIAGIVMVAEPAFALAQADRHAREPAVPTPHPPRA